MLSDEEKKFKASHFENIDELIKTCEMWIQDDDWDAYCRFFDMGAMEELINLIEKQSKEIEHLKEKRENQKKELAILNEKQIEFNKLVNTVNSYKGQFKKQQKEIEELKNADLTTVYLNGFYDGEKKAKDKLKAKIEELDNQKRQWIEDRNNKHKDSELIYAIEVLQSLLEKE